MKIALCLLVLLPLVYCASIEERFLFSVDEAVQYLRKELGSDTSEAVCEAGCPTVLGAVPGLSLAAPFVCQPACQKLQELAGK